MPGVRKHEERLQRLQAQRNGQVAGSQVQKLRKAISRCSNMTASTHEIRMLVTELRIQLQKVQERLAWLALKQAELQPDDQVSLCGMMDAKQQCEIEKSVLAGHAMLVQTMLREKGITPDPALRRFLDDIRKCVWAYPF